MRAIDIVVVLEGEYLAIQGSIERAMYIVQNGMIMGVDPNGIVRREYTKGSFFGEECGVLSEPSRACLTYQALGATELLMLGRQEMFRLFEEFPGWKAMLSYVAAQRRVSDQRLIARWVERRGEEKRRERSGEERGAVRREERRGERSGEERGRGVI